MATPIAIAVVERDGCLLIGQRREGVPLAGLWEFPGGKIEAGESPEQAAVRECREEAGIDVLPLFRYPEHNQTYGHGQVQLIFVACQPAGGGLVAPRQPFCWVRREELPTYEFPAGNKGLLAMLADGPVNFE
jgi:8-oxo-dGTP diphosphatase